MSSFPLPALESVRDDVGRAFQAEQTDDMGCGHVSDAVADRLSRNDPPGFPQVGQCHLEDELDRSGDLGITDPWRRFVAHHRGGRRPAEPGTKDGIKPPDRLAERGLPKEQVSPRTRPVIPRIGKDEGKAGTAPWRSSSRNAAEVGLAPTEVIEGLDRVIAVGDDQHQPVIMVASRRPRVWATSTSVMSERIAQGITRLAGEVMKGVGGSRGERDQDLLAITPFTCFRLPDEPRGTGGRSLLHHQVAGWSPRSRMNSPPRTLGCPFAGPGREPLLHAEWQLVERDVGVRLGEMEARGDRSVVEAPSAGLIRPATPAAASRCPMLVFTEPMAQRRPRGRGPRPSTAPSAAPRSGRRAGCRCRAPRRNRPARARRRPVGSAVAEDRLLRRAARGREAVGAPVLVDRAAPDHGVDRVAVGQGAGQRLEHHDARPLAADVAVGPGVERLAPAVGRRGSRPAAKLANISGEQDQVHPAGQRQRRLAVPQALAGQVHGHQRRRAGRVDRQARPAEVEG